VLKKFEYDGSYKIPNLEKLLAEDESAKVTTRSLKWWEENRKEHFNFVKEYENCRRVIVDAEPKVGKRCFKIIEAQRKNRPNIKSYHLMITSLDRKDNKEQHREMEAYGIECFVSKKGKKFLECIEKSYQKTDETILDKLEKIYQDDSDEIHIYMDESDLGTAANQIMMSLFQKIGDRANYLEKVNPKKKFFLRYFSASNEEIMLSDYGKTCEFFSFTTPHFYRGAKWHLENNLVHEAEPFFIYHGKSIVPWKQGQKLLEEFKDSDKFFSILRIANKNKKNIPDFKSVKNNTQLQKHLLDNYNIQIITVDQHDSMSWGLNNGDSKNWSQYFTGPKKIFLINQTCTRSTELGFIPLIYFFHDFRGKNTPYNTIIQSALRVSHYPYERNERYWNIPEPHTGVHIYTNVNSIRYRAKEITLEELAALEPDRNISCRIQSRNKGKNYFRATPEMIAAREVEFFDIPQSVLNETINSEKKKQKYPAINRWASTNSKIIEHKKQYKLLVRDKNPNFIRALSGNNKANIARCLMEMNHHTVLAPIFIDGPNEKYQEDFNNLLDKHGDVRNKIALVTISEQEKQARLNWPKEKKLKTRNSMFNDRSILKLS